MVIGAVNTDGSYTFYTRGVDRLTSWDSTAFEKIPEYISEYVGGKYVGTKNGVPFTMADNLWISFQNGYNQFCEK